MRVHVPGMHLVQQHTHTPLCNLQPARCAEEKCFWRQLTLIKTGCNWALTGALGLCAAPKGKMNEYVLSPAVIFTDHHRKSSGRHSVLGVDVYLVIVRPLCCRSACTLLKCQKLLGWSTAVL
jgi:hypothetical protein